MKLKFYQQLPLGLAFLIFAALLAVSCNNAFRNKPEKIVVTHQFPNGNWAFEEEVLVFDFPISDTSKDYQIALNLKYDTAVVTLKDIPMTLTLNTPDGMQSIATSHFYLDSKDMNKLSVQKGPIAESSVIVYPKRHFKVAGNHKLTVYRRAEKADNYGFVELSAQVSPL